MAYKSTKTVGIRYREHPSRKHGRMLDKYYFIRYRLSDGTRKEEGVGWASEGWTETKVSEVLGALKQNISLGQHPQTLAEMRENQNRQKLENIDPNGQNKTLNKDKTVRDVFIEYLPWHQANTSDKTWRNTQQLYNNWIDTPCGDIKINELQVSDIQAIISDVLKTRSRRTALYVKAVIRQIFNYAKLRDMYDRENPANKVLIKMGDNKRHRFLTRKEASQLLEALFWHSQDLHDMSLLSLFAGLRAGEIFKLTWGAVNWTTNQLFIADPKNGEGRYEPIHPTIKEMLKQRLESTETPQGYIFKARNGGKIQEISKTFERVVAQLGFNKGITDPRQKVVFHTLRHTYASWLVMGGVDVYTTQKLLGHKSIQMTQRYAHLAPDYLDKAVKTIQSLD